MTIPSRKKQRSKDPTVLWEGSIASQEVDHAAALPYHDRAWHTHYLCCLHERDDARSKKSGFTIIKRRWYLTIDGTSRTFIPEHEALSWLLSRATKKASTVTIINQYECDLIRTIGLL